VATPTDRAYGDDPLTFNTLGLQAGLLRAIREQRYDVPTPIQQRAIPPILQGHDVLASAQTGTGKTASFVLPLLQRLMETTLSRDGKFRPVRALILVPTRELALQVSESVRKYGSHVPLSRTTIFGGVGMTPQREALRAGRDIIVATPGRLLDHLSQKTADLRHVEILVLDEADRMLDMGFVHDVKRILKKLPAKRQNLLFSATFSDQVRGFAEHLLERPQCIDTAPRNSPVEAIKQVVCHVDSERKPELLADLIHRGGWAQVLVFARTKHGADRLARKLERSDVAAAAIHGNKSQNARIKALSAFKQGKVRVLVATDIAARGLDIDGLPHVVNFDLPHVPEDYVHRIGRTGRAGAGGEAVSLVCPKESVQLRGIEKLLGRRLPTLEHSSSNRAGSSSGEPKTRQKKGAVPRDKRKEEGGEKGDRPRLASDCGKQSNRPHSRGRANERKREPGAVATGRSYVLSHVRVARTEKEMDMAFGNVKWFNANKGFGFIAPEGDGKDVFVHISALQRAGLDGLAEGQRIEFEIVPGRDGRAAAENLRLAD